MASPTLPTPDQTPKRISFPSGVVAEVPADWTDDAVNVFSRGVHAASNAATNAAVTPDQPVRIAFPGHPTILEVPSSLPGRTVDALAREVHSAASPVFGLLKPVKVYDGKTPRTAAEVAASNANPHVQAAKNFYKLPDGRIPHDIVWSVDGKHVAVQGSPYEPWVTLSR